MSERRARKRRRRRVSSRRLAVGDKSGRGNSPASTLATWVLAGDAGGCTENAILALVLGFLDVQTQIATTRLVCKHWLHAQAWRATLVVPCRAAFARRFSTHLVPACVPHVLVRATSSQPRALLLHAACENEPVLLQVLLLNPDCLGGDLSDTLRERTLSGALRLALERSIRRVHRGDLDDTYARRRARLSIRCTDDGSSSSSSRRRSLTDETMEAFAAFRGVVAHVLQQGPPEQATRLLAPLLYVSVRARSMFALRYLLEHVPTATPAFNGGEALAYAIQNDLRDAVERLLADARTDFSTGGTHKLAEYCVEQHNLAWLQRAAHVRDDAPHNAGTPLDPNHEDSNALDRAVTTEWACGVQALLDLPMIQPFAHDHMALYTSGRMRHWDTARLILTHARYTDARHRLRRSGGEDEDEDENGPFGTALLRYMCKAHEKQGHAQRREVRCQCRRISCTDRERTRLRLVHAQQTAAFLEAVLALVRLLRGEDDRDDTLEAIAQALDVGVEQHYALNIAVRTNHVEATRALVTYPGADRAMQSWRMQHLLFSAVRRDHADVASLLVREGRAPVTPTTVMTAVMKNNVETTRILLEVVDADDITRRLSRSLLTTSISSAHRPSEDTRMVVLLLESVDPSLLMQDAIRTAARLQMHTVARILLRDPRVDPFAFVSTHRTTLVSAAAEAACLADPEMFRLCLHARTHGAARTTTLDDMMESLVLACLPETMLVRAQDFVRAHWPAPAAAAP